jgi:glycosyltransferase involved in cell wall biosynthesis
MHLAIFMPAYRVDSAMAGIGVRAWELAQIISSSMPVTIVARANTDLRARSVHVVAATKPALQLAAEECSAGLFFDMPDASIMLSLYKAGKLIITDNSVPIEHLEYHSIKTDADPEARYRELVDGFKLQLLLSDLFILRSNVYRSVITGCLSLVGRLTFEQYKISSTLDHLFCDIPVGYNRYSAARASQAEPALPVVDFTWSGGIWDYYDPVSLAKAVARLKRRGVIIKVRFMYPTPPQQVLKQSDAVRKAVQDLGVQDCIEFLERGPPHLERDGVIKSARSLVCIGVDGIENYTSIRLRLRDCFLYNLPLLVDQHGATADLVRALDIGLTVDSRDPDSIADGLERLSKDRSTHSRLVANLRDVRHTFQLDEPTRHLVNFIKTGKRTAHLGVPRLNAQVHELLRSNPSLARQPNYPF